MKLMNRTKIAALVSTVMLSVAPSVLAQLTFVNIHPTNVPPAIVGTYTPGAPGAGTLTSDGVPFFPPAVTDLNVGDAGDVMAFAYEALTNDFDKRVRITAITGDAAVSWARAALMVRTGTNSWKASLQLVASNPLNAQGGRAALCARAIDGQAYSWISRYYDQVTNALPNQWLRLRRVGDYFAAYLGTNGTTWTLIGERYQILPSVLFVGPSAAGADSSVVSVGFTNYGNTPSSDAIAPALVSAGTLDKKVVGVRFSEPVNSTTAKVVGNYLVTQTVGGPVTINSIKMGIGGDAVYLSVSGLTSDNFTVRVIGGVRDTAGNTITPNVQVAARALNWNHGDQGYVQDTNNRPQPGDDPGTVGQAVMISSDENPEVEIVGGGSNSWNPGDFIHYIWRTTPLSGNFDVTIAVSRNDRPANGAGWANSGIMLRAAVEYTTNLSGELLNPSPNVKTNLDATKVQMVLNTTYTEGAGIVSGPGRGSIPLWRTTPFGGYGNGNAGFGAYNRVISSVKGYYSGLNGTNASGQVDSQSVPDSARYLRIQRVGTLYTFYASWDRTTWAIVDGPINLPTLPDQLLLGFSTMNDTGGSNPPFSAYGGNGHNIDPADPYSEASAGGRVQNDSNYSVQRIKVFPNGVSDPVPVALANIDIRPADASSLALSGSWTSTGSSSFDMTGGGTGVFKNTGSPDTGGDELTFAYETVTGDFDKQVNITSLTNRLFNNDGSAIDTNVFIYTLPFPIDAWARAGLMVRSDTNAYNQCLKIVAANPAGANVVRVMGRGIDAQNYTLFTRDYPGVSNAIPNQYLRMKRVGNSFSFFASKDGVVWSLMGQTYQPSFPSTVYFGPYCAASLNPADAAGNPDGLASRAIATFASYLDVEVGDVAGPVLISAGTIDKKTVGVKFNEPVGSATATVPANYSLSQGPVTAARVGIGGDSVYLTVSGLSANTFTVTVTNVTDTTGNKIAANSSVNAKVTGLTSVDIGLIQNASPRTPTPGDDPYRIGEAVATSSDDAPEVEIVGGGSNAWNPGDFLHWLYSPTPIVGNFDVAVKVSRNDRPNNTAGWANSGLMLRASVFNAGEENTVAGTQVPMVANTTYIENSSPGRAAIPLFRTDVHGGYGNGSPVGWPTLINGIKGYYSGLRAIDSVGTPDPESSATSARWLRIQRVGTLCTFLWSYDGLNWSTESSHDLPTLTSLLLGFSTMNDTGGGAPPFGGYGGNGHTIDPADPLNPANQTIVGGLIQNESNYSVQKIRLYSNTASIGKSSVALVGGQISVTYSGTLQSAANITGPYTTVPRQSSPYLVTPTSSRLFFRVLP